MHTLQFGGLEPQYTDYAQADYLVLPVPYDQTSTWMKGADQGPKSILEASAHMELYDIETDTEPYLAGIHTLDELICQAGPEVLFEEILALARQELAQGKFLITLGGNHSVPIGVCKAYSEKYADLSVLQIDAHADMRESYEGNPYSHACAMARMKEWAKPVGVGIRSMDSSEKENVAQADIFLASRIHRDPHWVEAVLTCLGEHVYLTIDLDGLDPSIMPATGTPEPGGLGWYQVLDLFEAVIQHKTLVGFDVVELCPGENTYPSHFLVAKLIYKILAMMERKKYEKTRLFKTTRTASQAG